MIHSTSIYHGQPYGITIDDIIPVLFTYLPSGFCNDSFGIDVTQLMLSSGWSASKAEKSNLSDNDATSWVAGLVMLA
ncbi:MAG: hypothetical protein DRH90_15175 [Deltaproteobacteria bacterium]|nr:MAG: hypothetical protein DRH90_15175 [Deltaproteobacteria bacterium]